MSAAAGPLREGGRAPRRPADAARGSRIPPVGKRPPRLNIAVPAIAARGRANYCPPRFPPGPCRRRRRIGASPSGKATDFDSVIRRFESSRPSQTSLSP